MKIVIDIDDIIYKEAVNSKVLFDEYVSEVAIAIINGIPLPEHHGRLIDANSLIKAIEEKAKRLRNTDTINGLCGAVALIFDAPTIIEADKESNSE